MEKIRRTIDDVFEMSESRYSLVNAISRKAREIADKAESNNDVLYRKPVNMVIDRLLDGRATIEHIQPQKSDEDDFNATWHASYMAEAGVPLYAELEAADEDESVRDEDADYDSDAEDEDPDRDEDEDA
ncbi:MAG: DNA-directed RNA polymerase subunit omega [Clostridia bacterium]|nr:DNA-directed RNA polymerase subunit omega [Clostridia bacterium]